MVVRELHTASVVPHPVNIRAVVNDSLLEDPSHVECQPGDHRQPKPGQMHLAMTLDGRGTVD
jgi:hypothetical protein